MVRGCFRIFEREKYAESPPHPDCTVRCFASTRQSDLSPQAGRGKERQGAQAPAIACSIADSAASALAPSGPPACAMSGLPPPPLPPSASEPLRTSSTALKREVRSAVTQTPRRPLPSTVTPKRGPPPEPICFL